MWFLAKHQKMLNIVKFAVKFKIVKDNVILIL